MKREIAEGVCRMRGAVGSGRLRCPRRAHEGEGEGEKGAGMGRLALASSNQP